MRTLPPEIMIVFAPFMQVVSRRVWKWVEVLVIGAILAPGKRTVTSILHVMGLKAEKQYQNYHRVLNRVRWSSFALSQILLGMLVAAFVAGTGPVVLGADETLERLWGLKIKARSIFHDSKRSSHHYPNFMTGLRWLSMMMLVPVPWCTRAFGRCPFSPSWHPARRQMKPMDAATRPPLTGSVKWLLWCAAGCLVPQTRTNIRRCHRSGT